MLSQAVPCLLVTAIIFFPIPKKFLVLLSKLFDKSTLIHSQLIYVYSTSKWFNTSSNDLYISDLLMPEKTPAEVYVNRGTKSNIEQYTIAVDYMLKITHLNRAE